MEQLNLDEKNEKNIKNIENNIKKLNLDDGEDEKNDWKNRKDWRCGKCGKTYTLKEFIGLTKLVENEGYVPVCECGYRFLIDKWRLHDHIKLLINGIERNILVSTVDLEFNHGFKQELWYETMIFVEDEEGKDYVECYYENRYNTKQEALKDHEKILNLLRNGNYEIEKDEINDKFILRIIER